MDKFLWYKLDAIGMLRWQPKEEFFYYTKHIGGYRIDITSTGYIMCIEDDVNGFPLKLYPRKANKFIKKLNVILKENGLEEIKLRKRVRRIFRFRWR